VVKKFSPATMQLNQNLGQDHPLRVLVVDDNNVNQIVASSLLGKIGYRTDLASNGLEALDALWRQPYDIIFMDGQMPEMDGEEATRQIRQRLPASQQPCIVAMTANAMQGDRERYLACGMDDYISKPIRVEELVRVLTNAQPINSEPADMVETLTAPEGNAAAAPETRPVTPAMLPVENPTPDSSGELRQAAIDPAVLQEFFDLMGDDEQAAVANLVRLYLDDCPLLIEKMRQALPTADCDSLHRQAHTLKGNSDQMGAGPLAEVSAALEQLAKGGSCEGAEGYIQQIEMEFERVKTGLNSFIEIPAEQSS
jgi:CheY-like chemotaxis protein